MCAASHARPPYFFGIVSGGGFVHTVLYTHEPECLRVDDEMRAGVATTVTHTRGEVTLSLYVVYTYLVCRVVAHTLHRASSRLTLGPAAGLVIQTMYGVQVLF